MTPDILANIKLFGYTISVCLFNYLNIPNEQVSILWILMFIDFLSGILKQYTLDPLKIESSRAKLGLLKKIGLLLALLSIALAFRSVDIIEKHYIKSIFAIVIMAETYSIIQNIYTARTGKIVKEFDAISLVLEYIWKFFEKHLKKIMGTDGDDVPPKK